ncbi:MAG: carboxylesterase family protein, partial [Bdellovibrionaceae bacterium]|nr:carboxylesterase family protein [Pseudobdellovibrionaceae bacterium]
GLFSEWLETRSVTKRRGEQLTDELVATVLQEGKVKFRNCRRFRHDRSKDNDRTSSPLSDQCLKALLFETSMDELAKTSLFNRYKTSSGVHFDPVLQKTGFQFHPVLDYKYVVGGVLDIFNCQQQKDLPLIVGSMGWEATIVESSIQQNPKAFFEGIPEPQIRTAYLFPKTGHTSLLAERFYGDKTFGVPAELMARFHSQKNENTYLYFFNYIGDEMSYSKGATHHLLTPFVFRTLETTDIKNIYKPSPVDRAVASVWSGYWQAFINATPTANDAKTPLAYNLNQRGIASITPHSPPPWGEYDAQLRNRLFINQSGNFTSTGQREFGDRETYNYDLQGAMSSRYALVEKYFYSQKRFSICDK